MRGIKHKRGPTWAKNVAESARRRMLSDANPMKNPEKHRAAMQKILSRQKSKNEISFETWIERNGVNLRPTGDGSFWIGRRNPDYRVPKQRKVVELTMKECFIGYRKKRDPEGYGMDTIRHYRSKGWECLVIFRKDYRTDPPAELRLILENFMRPKSDWSGVWHFDRLIPYGQSVEPSMSTTSPVPQMKPLKPMG
jgi:hypothetical protein